MGDVIDLPGAAEPVEQWSPPDDPRDTPWWDTGDEEASGGTLVLAPPESDPATGQVPDTFRSAPPSDEASETVGLSEVTAVALALATATGIEALRSLGSVSAAAMERAAHWRKERQAVGDKGAEKAGRNAGPNKTPSAAGSAGGSGAGPGRGGKGGGRATDGAAGGGKGRAPAGPHHKPGRDETVKRHKAPADGAGKAGKDARSGKPDKPGKGGDAGTGGKQPSARHETARDGLSPKSPRKSSDGKGAAGPGSGSVGGGGGSTSGKDNKGSGKSGSGKSSEGGSSKGSGKSGSGKDQPSDRHQTGRDGLPPKDSKDGKRGKADSADADQAPDSPPEADDATAKPTTDSDDGSRASTPWSAAWDRWKKRHKSRKDRDDMNDSGAAADDPAAEDPAAPGGATPPGGAPGGEGASWRTDGWRTTAYDGVTYTVERDDQPPGGPEQPADAAQAPTTGQAALTTGQATLPAAPHRNPKTVQRPGTRRPRPMPGGKKLTDLITRGGADAALPSDQTTEISATDAVRVFADMAAEMVSDYDDTVELSRRLGRLASSIENFIDVLPERNIRGRSMARGYELLDQVHSLSRTGEEFSKTVMDGYEEALDTEAYLEDHYMPVTDTTADQGLSTPSTRAHNQGD